MAHPRLRSPDQPFPLRAALGLYEFCASLKLAVVLIFAAAAILGAATFYESSHGLEAVQFGLYGTWWFTALNALLALNIFCAASIRYPWKRYQTGFVITHIGLLTLLFGCWLSRSRGIDAQLPVFEGQANSVAIEDDQHFQLNVIKVEGDGVAIPAEASDSDAQRLLAQQARKADATPLRPIPFVGGPFNWEEYDKGLPFFPWKLAGRDEGVLYDQDGIRLEVLDYYSNAKEIRTPNLTLKISNPRMSRMNESGREELMDESFSDVNLAISATKGLQPSTRQNIGGGTFLFWIAETEAETQAFLNSAPEGELEGLGQLVLWLDGKKHVLPVELKKETPVGDTGYSIEVTGHRSAEDSPHGGGPSLGPSIAVELIKGDQRDPLVVYADIPDQSLALPEKGVFGSYWVKGEKKTAQQLMAGGAGSRIDIIQSHDQKLYYRYWNREKVVAIAPLPLDGELVDAFKMPIAQLKMKVADFRPSERPGREVLPVAFDKSATMRDSFRAARVAMTVDGTRDEFWLVGATFDPLFRPRSESSQRFVQGKNRIVGVTLDLEEISVGYDVRLKRFERTLDPGTSQAAHFGSMLDLEKKETGDVVQRDVHIVMNAPVDIIDPESGRKLRLFQESFRGPFQRGDGIYEMVYASGAPGDKRFMSVLTVNYDPGRGFKYVGCLLVVAGIATMFYMRAYFFKRPAAPVRPATTSTTVQSERPPRKQTQDDAARTRERDEVGI